MTDVVRMLGAIGEGEGVAVEPVTACLRGPHAFVRLRPGPTARLRNEVGVHRAQVVTPTSQSGRIGTCLVGVELLAEGMTPSSGRPEGPVLKTYNYVLKRVTRHSTGTVSPLDGVLSGSEA